MEYCSRCLQPDTRPNVKFHNCGVCFACGNWEAREHIDWVLRHKMFRDICDSVRSPSTNWDCLIPVSGGKDSHYQVWYMKEVMKMNPLLLTITDPFPGTEAGEYNLRNMSVAFNVDHMMFNYSADLFRRTTRISFEENLDAFKFLEDSIAIIPIHIALKLRIPLIVDGEDGPHEYGEHMRGDGNSLRQSIDNKTVNLKYWLDRGIRLEELVSVMPLTNTAQDHIGKGLLKSVYLSHYDPWSSVKHHEVAKRYGFKDLHHEWDREGCIDAFEQIDSFAYMVYYWLKYPKFGYQRATNIAARRVREGLITRDEAIRLVRDYDHKLDRRGLDVFCDFLGYTHLEFWGIVDQFWNTDIFEQKNWRWALKDPIYKGLPVREYVK